MPVTRRLRLPALFTARVVMPLSLAGGLLLPSNAAWALLCYILLLPAVLVRVCQGWRPDLRDRSHAAMLALCTWSTLAILWDHNISQQGAGHGYWLLNAACTFGFLFCFKMADGDDPAARARAVSVLIGAGAINALVSLVMVLAHGDWSTRMTGWGATKNPVLGAAILDICILLALGRIAEGGRQRRYYIAALVPMVLYLGLSYSRTPLVAMACALLIIAFNSWAVFGRVVLAGLCVVLAAGLVWWARPDWAFLFMQNLLARGTDCHLTIWQTAWHMFQSSPLVGYGPSARLPILPHGFCPAYPSPHNLYLSLLLYSGLVGFLLFWACELLLWRHLRHVTTGFRARLWLAVMVVPLVAGLSDLTQVIKGPSPMWYIIWVPMLLVMTLRPAKAP
ncbi:MAG TPA: O-antigen ligase family protein [Acidocella sp.]|nr:O-antigen ligase family protein [Acidocella sp.]